MLAKKIAGLLGVADPDAILAADKLITSFFKSEEFRKGKLYELAFGSTPPHSEEVEAAFIGAALLNPQKAVAANLDISEEDFYLDRYRLMWRAMLALYQTASRITPVSVSDFLKEVDVNGISAQEIVGGQMGVEETQFGQADYLLAKDYASRLKQYSLQRKSVELCLDGASRLLGTSAAGAMELRAEIVSGLTKAGSKLVGQQVSNGAEISEEIRVHMARMKDWAERGIEPDWAMSPVKELNAITGGWKPTDLIIIAARPGMGKTGYMLSEVNYALNHDEAVGIFSLEMSKLQLGVRLLLMNSMISNQAMRTGKISNYEMIEAGRYLEHLKTRGLYVDDTPGISIDQLEQRATMMAEEFGVKRLYVDYLQLMSGPQKGNRETEVSAISRGLKGVAKKLDIPVIALSQLSRAVETRGGSKRPQLSDLRESGSIEQDSDVVGFLYRPLYYGVKEDEEGNPITHSEIIIAKHRNGPVDIAKAMFLESRMEWCSFANSTMPTGNPSIDDLVF